MADAAFLISRIVSVCGEKRGANMEILVAEWHDALRFFDKQRIDEVWRSYRDTPPCHWPKPADIVSLVRASMPTTSHRYEPPEPRPPFCRDGRTVSEEIAFRTEEIAAIKRRWAYTPAFDYVPTPEAPSVIPPAQ